MNLPLSHLLLMIVVVLSSCQHGHSDKILLITAPMYSHCGEVSSVGREPLKKGHSVSIFLPADFNRIGHQCYDTPSGGRKIVPLLYNTDPGNARKRNEESFSPVFDWLTRGNPPSIMEYLGVVTSIAETLCSNIMADGQALENLEDENFDFAIVTGYVVNYCFFAIPYKLGIPYVSVGTLFEDITIGMPFLPSISPHYLSGATGDMTIFQRGANMFTHLIFHAWNIAYFPLHSLAEYTPELNVMDVLNLVSYSELFLHNMDEVLAYPIPKMPNHILVGGLSARPAGQLSSELDSFYQKAKNGVVVVSFGSVLRHLPESISRKLLAALRKLDTHVIWHGNEKEIGNVKGVKWLPQNDLLGHPKTRLFISHCGSNGLYEALYHAVPIVCTPIVSDQFFNADRVEYWKVGTKINFYESMEDEILAIINATLFRRDFHENMKRASQIYHNRPDSPGERAAFWIEHVINYGGKHLRPETAGKTVFTLLGLDCVCFYVAVVVSMAILLYNLVRFIVGKCTRVTRNKTEGNRVKLMD